MNRKGFTLVEILATLVILSVILVIGCVAINKTIDNSNKRNYEILLSNIIEAATVYYQEYNYGGMEEYNNCITLKSLVDLGYLNFNAKDSLINPETHDDITDCKISIGFDKIGIKVYGSNYDCKNTISSCPTNADFNGVSRN